MEGVFKGLSNVGIKSRTKQLIILLVAIVLGMIISSAVNAQNFYKAKARFFQAKYKKQIRLGPKECYILSKKRNKRHRAPLFALQIFDTQKRKMKFRPQAEVDPPGSRKQVRSVVSNN